MKFFKFLFKLCFVLTSLVLIAGLLGFAHPALDSLSHFRLHLSVIILAACVIALLFKFHKLALLGFIIGGLCFYLSLEGTILTTQSHESDQSRPVYSALHFNLLWNNLHRQAVREKMLALDPDIIMVTEGTRTWFKALDKLSGKWPYLFVCNVLNHTGGTKIYSKWPIIKGSEVCLEYASYAKVTVMPPDGNNIDVLAPHFRWPWPASGPKQLQKIKPRLQTVADDAIVAGDFNATTWSWAVHEFANIGGLQIYPGIGSTWMVDGDKYPFAMPLGLPIDNVMQKGRVNILSAQTLPNWGSDHLPILVKFQLK